MATTLGTLGTALARSAPAGVAALRDPTAVAVTFRTAFTPPWTVRPFAPGPAPPPPAQPGPAGWVSRAVMGTVRPAFDIHAGSEVISLEPGGDPDELPLGKLTVGLTAAGIALAGYGAWCLWRDLRG